MLNTLHMINFRRHVDTEVDFSDDAQIVAITGRNGTGKSTLLEALVFAFYGESRHGRRGLAKMVRRGEEYSGMQVELEFTIDTVRYRIHRRYDAGKSSARLFINGNDAVQSPDGVTREVTRILGMDSNGFRLAVIAQQGDVEGLADLTAAKRRQTVTRLLRQDALTAAAGRARDIHNREVEIWKAMRTGPDLDALLADEAAAKASAAEALAAVGDSRAALAALDTQLAEGADLDGVWHRVQLEAARAEATSAAANAEVARLAAERDSIRVPAEVPKPARSAASVLAALSEVNIAIAKAETARELAETAAATRAELAKAHARLAALAETIGADTPASLAMDTTRAGSHVDALEVERAAAQRAIGDLRAALAELRARDGLLSRRDEQAAQLGDVCDVCEQPITAEHRERQAAERAAARSVIDAEVARISGEETVALAAARKVETDLGAARRAREEIIARRGAVTAACKERDETARRIEQYEARLARITVSDIDIEPLYADKGRLEVEKSRAEQYELVSAARDAALARAKAADAALTAARSRAEEAKAAADAAQPDHDLLAAHTAREELREARAGEAELLAAVEQQAAVAGEQVNSATRAIADARSQHERALGHRRAADRSAKAAAVLKATAEHMATLIRPALEAEVSALLTQLSEGRFTRAKVSDDYEITVEDDGSFEQLSEFSGGQRVLIALATRLALANIVAERQSGDGVGFLILDEVFGSQDEGRREAILSCLRAMRAIYGQILLISHVGGFEDAADRVLAVSEAIDDGRRVAQVEAG